MSRRRAVWSLPSLKDSGFGRAKFGPPFAIEPFMKTKKVTARGLKVIWAVDAFQPNAKAQIRALQSFLKMGRATGAVIQPVAVLHPGSYDPVSGRFPGNWKAMAGRALENLIDAFESISGVGISPVRLLRVEKSSLSASVDALVSFAIEENASLILVSSRSRSGLERMTMGSFAESLVLRSPVPVLVANPRSKPHDKVTTILYPTDFSPASRKGLDRVVTMARTLGMQILLYHKIRLPIARLVWEAPPNASEAMRKLKGEGKAWVRRAELSGVRAKIHIEADIMSPVDSILRVSRKLGVKSMIAMTSQSGAWSSALLGSLTRQVLRHATCPVLVVHPDQPSLAKRVLQDIKLAGFAYTAHPLPI